MSSPAVQGCPGCRSNEIHHRADAFRAALSQDEVAFDGFGEDLDAVRVEGAGPRDSHRPGVRGKLYTHDGVMPVAAIPPSRLGTVVVDVPVVHCVDAKPFKRLHLPIRGDPRAGIVDCPTASLASACGCDGVWGVSADRDRAGGSTGVLGANGSGVLLEWGMSWAGLDVPGFLSRPGDRFGGAVLG